ncbi:MAG: 23S rRNA (adenine(2030)-N(6))-methyltransferase RlmJ [Serpentinimonas sp.]|jgi:23S rRNA (adenine2030-N6)-methyltransferase|nr:23S rRNA (adenine(2030)-N(6))-methyltransferase RlmJ [Serpentinimonas sp.]
MFSYRHAFHAGNHADVLKHMTLVAILRYMAQKDTGFSVVDTHAGAGVYRLDQEHARTSAESDAGLFRLLAALPSAGTKPSGHASEVPALVADYVSVVMGFNSGGSVRTYPGSPWIAQALLRPQDKLKLFEVHPTDARLLERHVAELGRGKQIEVLRSNGFEGWRSTLPPPTRRGLLLMDPSYELKTDYAEVLDALEEATRRFPTGTYAVWYPVIARPESHSLARKLKALGTRLQKPWVQAELNVGLNPTEGTSARVAQGRAGTVLRASGMHIINPPYTLAADLRAALPWVQQALQQKTGAGWTVETS